MHVRMAVNRIARAQLALASALGKLCNDPRRQSRKRSAVAAFGAGLCGTVSARDGWHGSWRQSAKLLDTMLMLRRLRTVASKHRVMLHLIGREDLRGQQMVFQMSVPQFGLSRADLSNQRLEAFISDRTARELLVQ